MRSWASITSASHTLVVFEVAKREVRKAGLLVVADVVLDACAGAVAALQQRDVRVGLVGQDRLEAVAVMVGERQLRAGMRALTANDHSRPLGPVGEVQAGEFADLPVGTLAAVLVDGRDPVAVCDLQDLLAHVLAQIQADGEADVRAVRPVEQLVAGARAVGAQKHPDRLDVLARDLLQRRFSDRDLIAAVFAPALPGRSMPPIDSRVSSQ